jgi:glucose-1-phosphate adenylyltransferase
MSRPRVLAIIQAGGAGGRMDVLTRERAKPALPFAGVYQLVDFPLSNLAHSGVTDVWLSLQFQGATLEEQVANGRPWDLDRSHGGLRLLMPEQGTGTLDEEGFARGNADGLFRIRAQIATEAPDVVVVLSADHVYRLDYTEVIDAHLAAGAECTIVTTEVPIGEAGDHGVVVAGDDDRVTDFAYKPEDPETGTIAAEIIVYDPLVLVTVLEELHRELGADSDAGDTGIGDFGDHLVPRLVERGATYAWALGGYWRDVGQPHHYLQAHQDVLTDDVGVLAVPGWPILTRQPQRVPGRVLDGGRVVDSMLSPGSRVAGTVVRSVIGPGVVVEAGAEVHDSVVFADSVVLAGSRVHWAVVDTRCSIGPDARVGEPEADGTGDPDAVTLVGQGSVVGDGVKLAAGARLEPGSSA